MTIRLIVNADDFGLTEGVNRAIEEAHSQGLLTSTTVLVGRDAAQAAGDVSRRCPDLGFGLHVNLTLGPPISDPGSVRTLVDDEGRLMPPGRLLKRVVRGQVDAADVRREVAAQAARLRSFGVEPTHWDSHQAMGFWPGVVGPAAVAAAEAGIPCARSPRVWITDRRRRNAAAARWAWRLGKPRRIATESARRVALATLSRRFTLPRWRLSPNLVEGIEDYATRWRVAFDALPPATAEMVSHPGYVDDELREVTPGLVDDRSVDLQVMKDPKLAERLRDGGVELVNFRALVG
jgi:chitin disaccharide deacetylase